MHNWARLKERRAGSSAEDVSKSVLIADLTKFYLDL